MTLRSVAVLLSVLALSLPSVASANKDQPVAPSPAPAEEPGDDTTNDDYSDESATEDLSVPGDEEYSEDEY